MEVKYYANFTIKDNSSVFPVTQTKEISSLDIKKIVAPKNTIKIETYSVLTTTIEYNGQDYLAFTKPINKKTYHIGRLLDMESYQSKNGQLRRLYENKLIKGVVVTAYSDEIVGLDDEVIDPNTLIKEQKTVKKPSKTQNSANNSSQTDL